MVIFPKVLCPAYSVSFLLDLSQAYELESIQLLLFCCKFIFCRLLIQLQHWTHQHLSFSVFLFEIFIRLKKGCHALLRCFLMPSVTAPSNYHSCDRQTLLHRPLLRFQSLLGLLSVQLFWSLFTAFSSSPSLPAVFTTRSVMFCMYS